MDYSEKQTAIIETAERLFSKKGYDGTSVRDIATEAGINVAMISYYFGSKEKLMEAVFESKTAGLRLKVENLIHDKELTPIQKINTLIDDYVNKFIDQTTFHTIMMREQLTEKRSPVWDMILELKKKNFENIRLLILDGQKQGIFKKNIDILMMMSTMVGTVSQTVSSEVFYREINGMNSTGEAEFRVHIKKKLSIHLKKLFKAVLTYENS
jgi:AcrR family transcriptional regulator